jgi:transposase InsO family protein
MSGLVWALIGVCVGFQLGVFAAPNYRLGNYRIYRRLNRIWGHWWLTCPRCGWQVRELMRMHVEIPNQATAPNADGPLIVDEMMCRDCARMFGVPV